MSAMAWRSSFEGNSLVSRSLRYDDASRGEAKALGVKPYGAVTALAVLLNYMVGTGCFGLPFAFQQSGLVMTAVLLLMGGLLALITMNYTLEICARAQGVWAAKHTAELPRNRMTYRKFGFASIGDTFGGSWGRNFAQIAMSLYGLGALWSYCSVFASSLSALVYTYVLHSPCNIYSEHSNGCEAMYYVSIAIFAALVLTMSLMEVAEQATIQGFLTAHRLLALFLMLLTLAIRVVLDWPAVTNRAQLIGAANTNMFALAFGSTMLALNCHCHIPDALQPLANKAQAKAVAVTALGLGMTLYLLLGVLGAVAVDNVSQLATLMWSEYTACGSGWDVCAEQTYVSKASLLFVQLIIMTSPIVNVTSAFPLVVVTIGDNILVSIPSATRYRVSPAKLKAACRLAVAIPPILLAATFKRLDLVFSLAGLFGFVLFLVLPAAFQLLSLRYCQRHWPNIISAVTTPYTWWPISNQRAAAFIVLIGGIFTGLAVVMLNNV